MSAHFACVGAGGSKFYSCDVIGSGIPSKDKLVKML